jgi:hypothetical protein
MATATLSAQPQAAGRQRPAPWSAARVRGTGGLANAYLNYVRGRTLVTAGVAAYAAQVRGTRP